jgi:hypothetical protein
MASTNTANNAQQFCPRCTEVATKLCGTCKSISYCSLECQQADWPVHKSVCKIFQAFTEPRPSLNVRRVIIFFPENKKPQFIWAPVKDGSNGGETMWPPDFIKHLKGVSWRPIEAHKNGWTDRNIGCVMQVWHDDDFLSIMHLNPSLSGATQGLDAAGWRGPMMVCCQSLPDAQFANEENVCEGVKVLDMDTRAFSHLASFLVNHSN